MIFAAQFLVPLAFGIFAFLDCTSIIAKHAGYDLQLNAMGYTLTYTTTVISRLFAFVFPPLLGIIVLSQDQYLIIQTTLISFLTALILCGFVRWKYHFILDSYKYVIEKFSDNSSMPKSILKTLATIATGNLPRNAIDNSVSVFSINWRTFLLCASIVTLYALPGFLLNLFASFYIDNAAVILQLNGMITGVGTIMMAFFLEPLISLHIDKKMNVRKTINSLLWGRIFCYAVSAPVTMLALYYILDT